MQTLLLLAALLPAAPVPVAPAPRAFIVIAGINDYADKEVPSRPHPEEDARALHDLLADCRYLGAGKDQMRLLLGKSATRRALLESMQWLRERAGPDDLVLFAFFGQGATLDERGERIGYLAADSTLAGRSRDAVSAGDVAEVFDRLRSRRVCVLLDVPFTGFRTKRSVAQPSPTSQLFRDFAGDDGTSEKGPLPGRLVLAREGRFAPDLCAGLRGEADTGAGVVTSAGLAAFLTKRLDEKQPALRIFQGEGAAVPLTLNLAVRRKPVEIVPLDRKAAEKYADKVLELCDVIHEAHYLAPDVARLLDLGIRGLYDRLREPTPADIVRRLGGVKDMDATARRKLLGDVRQRLGKRDDLNDNDVVWTMQEMLARFDRRSSYERSGPIICTGTHAGVGLVLRKNAATDLLEVVTPLLNSPAHKAGIRAGDVIRAITRFTESGDDSVPTPETVSTRGLSLKACEQRLCGKNRTRVRVTVQNPDEDRPREIEMARANDPSGTVLGMRRKRDGSWDHWLDARKKIGYIRIAQFRRTTPDEMRAALQKFQNEGVKGLVLDLRFNSGGLLQSVKDVASLFLKEGIVMTMWAPRLGATNEVIGIEPGKVLFEKPLVVLINEETISVGEVLAACLQDYKRGAIVGQRSHGKGSIQNVYPAGDAELMLTTVLFLRPSGKTWMSWQDGEGGVTPDKGFEVRVSRREREELWEHLRNREILPPRDTEFKDVQLDKALEQLRR